MSPGGVSASLCNSCQTPIGFLSDVPFVDNAFDGDLYFVSVKVQNTLPMFCLVRADCPITAFQKVKYCLGERFVRDTYLGIVVCVIDEKRGLIRRCWDDRAPWNQV